MAAAARPGARPGDRSGSGLPKTGDARVPCPLCGGLIHPIAGRCKHCKADLTSYRAARPAAAAPLPALSQSASNGHAAHAAVSLPASAQPVLPPRPTAPAAGARPAGTAWRSWPVVVIILAMMAIVAAVVLMVWPAHGLTSGKRGLPPPPAPERMDTQTPAVTPGSDPRAAPPSPSSAPADPWAAPGVGAGTSAPRPDPPVPSAAPADPSARNAPDNDVDLRKVDPLAGPPQPQIDTPYRLSRELAFAMSHRLCRKMIECGTIDARACDVFDSVPHALPASCPAAERCLERIDAMNCSLHPDATQAFEMLTQFRDCADAVRC